MLNNNYQQIPLNPIPYSPDPNSGSLYNISNPPTQAFNPIPPDVYQPSSTALDQNPAPKENNNTNLYLGLGIVGTIAAIGLYALTKGKAKNSGNVKVSPESQKLTNVSHNSKQEAGNANKPKGYLARKWEEEGMPMSWKEAGGNFKNNFDPLMDLP